MSLDEVIVKRNQGVNTTTEKVEYSETGVKVIRANNISTGIVDYSNCVYVAEKTFERIKDACKPQKGDILYTNIGSQLGNAALVNTDENFVIAWNVLRLQPSNKINADFLVYLLNNPSNKKMIQSLNSSSTMPFVSGGEIGKVEFSFPDLNKQAEIAKILKSLDDKIHLNNQINQTLESIAQAIFKSWFIDFEPVRAKIAAKQEGKDPERAAMCVISGKSEVELHQMAEDDFAELQATAALFPDEFVESELGEVPKEWEVKPLDKIANYLNGLALQKFRPENEYDFLPIVKIAQLKSGVATIEEKASPNIDRKFIIENGDVIFSWSGSLMVDIWCGGKAALNQHLFKVTSNDYHKWLYYFYTKHHLAEFQRIAQAKAVTMGHIKREHLSQALCCIASNQLLEISNIFIGHFLQKLIELRLENNNLKQLRDTLLPKLLSGEVEVENL